MPLACAGASVLSVALSLFISRPYLRCLVHVQAWRIVYFFLRHSFQGILLYLCEVYGITTQLCRILYHTIEMANLNREYSTTPTHVWCCHAEAGNMTLMHREEATRGWPADH